MRVGSLARVTQQRSGPKVLCLARPLSMMPTPPSSKREEQRPASPFLLPSAGLHTTPPLGHGYTNPKFPNRPISPHVMIYAFPVVALSSITMRVCGVLLSVGCGGVGAMACIDPTMPVELMSTLGSSPFLAIPAKFAVSFTLVYHFLGAVRHTVRRRLPLSKRAPPPPPAHHHSPLTCLFTLAEPQPRARAHLTKCVACWRCVTVLGPYGRRPAERVCGTVKLHPCRVIARCHSDPERHVIKQTATSTAADRTQMARPGVVGWLVFGWWFQARGGVARACVCARVYNG